MRLGAIQLVAETGRGPDPGRVGRILFDLVAQRSETSLAGRGNPLLGGHPAPTSWGPGSSTMVPACGQGLRTAWGMRKKGGAGPRNPPLAEPHVRHGGQALLVSRRTDAPWSVAPARSAMLKIPSLPLAPRERRIGLGD